MDLQGSIDALGLGYMMVAYIGFVVFLICLTFRGLGSIIYGLKQRFPRWWPSNGNPNEEHRQDFASAFLSGGICALLLKTALDFYLK